ncbi:MAG TPA: pirin family protein [Vicinamibacteria bacterium]|nr:pirin family protein [Vicinamibacteria bacterium]
MLQAITAVEVPLADGITVRRLLPRAARRMVGPWCFLDVFGPLRFESGKPMDVPPHPHCGLQTVTWLLEGEVLHRDSLDTEALARPGVLNLMTSGRGIAHSEETPPANSGRLHGVQLWTALPDAQREVEPSFEHHPRRPVARLEGGEATVILGELAGVRGAGRTFSPLVGADLAPAAEARLVVPLDPAFEYALVPLVGTVRLDGQPLAVETLYYAGAGRSELALHAVGEGARVLLLGGVPFGERILMWWNFVARTGAEIAAAREDWEAGRRFGEVRRYAGELLPAPPLVDRPVPPNPAS